MIFFCYYEIMTFFGYQSQLDWRLRFSMANAAPMSHITPPPPKKKEKKIRLTNIESPSLFLLVKKKNLWNLKLIIDLATRPDRSNCITVRHHFFVICVINKISQYLLIPYCYHFFPTICANSINHGFVVKLDTPGLKKYII